MARDDKRSRAKDHVQLVPEPKPPGLQHAPKGAVLPEPWVIQIVPLVDNRDDDPTARPVMVLVSSGQYLVHATRVRWAPGDPEGVAAIAAHVLKLAIASAGVQPRRVQVVHGSIAASLRPLVADGIDVLASREMPDAETVRGSFFDDYRARYGSIVATMSMPETFAAWRLPEDQIRRLFAAAAAFIRAEPWKRIERRPLLISVRGGGTWSADMLQDSEEIPELVLHSDLEDLPLDVYSTRHPDDPIRDMDGAGLHLSFSAPDIVPDPMLREVREAEWEVANPSAYPRLTTFSTPGGGMTPRNCEDLIVALHVIPRFAKKHGKRRKQRPEPLVDDALGVRCEYQPFKQTEPLWKPPDTLSPAGPEGPGARHGAQFERRGAKETAVFKDELLESFATYLEGTKGGKADPDFVDLCITDVQPFIHFLVGYHEIPPQAVTEFDLRAFLFSWLLERATVDEARIRSVPSSVRRYFEFLEAEERVSCPWAAAILEDEETFIRSWQAYPDEDEDEEKGKELLLQHVVAFHADCDARVFFPAGGENMSWYENGPVTSKMFDEVQRLWLVWRDEAIRDGVTTRKALEHALGKREREWLATPHVALGGETPATAIVREQAAVMAKRPPKV